MSNKWELINNNDKGAAEDVRPSLTYWQDVWRRFRGNILAMVGLVMLVIIVVLAIFGPMFSPYTYDQQIREFANLPPRLAITKIDDENFVYVTSDYSLLEVTSDGEALRLSPMLEDNLVKSYITYDVAGREVKLDYSAANKKNKDSNRDPNAPLYDLYVDEVPISSIPATTVHNKTFILGSDKMGRDLWTRNLYGARISLSVGVVAAILNAFVGVIYGGISGYKGGRVDNAMMRIVDIVNSIPLTLLVILISVVLGSAGGVFTIIMTIGLVYWLNMARQVRGQVLSLKEQEFVLAARALGASAPRLIFKHLIPNALGPIVVTMMMSIPSAIFTEAFLGFLGLGVSIPMASWGTLANDALGGIRSFPYLLIVPSFTIAFTIFAFNFVGDGLRDALDPKQR